MGRLGYIGHAEMLHSASFLPQRRLRARCVFFLPDSVSVAPRLAFSLCSSPPCALVSLDSILDAAGISQPVAKSSMKALQSKHYRLKWPRQTASFIKKEKLSSTVLNSCAAKLQHQGLFAQLTARQQRLLVARYAWTWQKTRLHVSTFPNMSQLGNIWQPI